MNGSRTAMELVVPTFTHNFPFYTWSGNSAPYIEQFQDEQNNCAEKRGDGGKLHPRASVEVYKRPVQRRTYRCCNS